MLLQQLKLVAFRNYAACKLQLPSGLIMFVGRNAAGKTNLLEAIGLLCNGVSHRGAKDRELVQWGKTGYLVKGTVQQRQAATIAVKYEPETGKQVTVHGTPLERRSDLLEYATAVIFTPDDLSLIKGEPGLRRRFIDRVASIINRRHIADWIELRSLLMQRNQLLRDVKYGRSSTALVDLFDEQFIHLSARIISGRVAALRQVIDHAREFLGSLTGGSEQLSGTYQQVVISSGDRDVDSDSAEYDQGQAQYWMRKARAVLEAIRAEELQRGQTLWGPQRDDVMFTIGGRAARNYASQGQQRSIVLALKHAESAITAATIGTPPILLLDDVFSELDEGRSRALLSLACAHEQTIVTAADDGGQSAPWRSFANAIYYVHNGSVQAVST